MKPASAQSDHRNNQDLSITTHRICDGYLSVRQIRWERVPAGRVQAGLPMEQNATSPLALAVIRLHVDGAQHQILL